MTPPTPPTRTTSPRHSARYSEAPEHGGRCGLVRRRGRAYTRLLVASLMCLHRPTTHASLLTPIAGTAARLLLLLFVRWFCQVMDFQGAKRAVDKALELDPK